MTPRGTCTHGLSGESVAPKPRTSQQRSIVPTLPIKLFFFSRVLVARAAWRLTFRATPPWAAATSSTLNGQVRRTMERTLLRGGIDTCASVLGVLCAGKAQLPRVLRHNKKSLMDDIRTFLFVS